MCRGRSLGRLFLAEPLLNSLSVLRFPLGAQESPDPPCMLYFRFSFGLRHRKPSSYGSGTGGRNVSEMRAFTSGVNHSCTDIVACCCATQAWTRSANGAHIDGWHVKISIRCSSFPAK